MHLSLQNKKEKYRMYNKINRTKQWMSYEEAKRIY